MKGAVFVAAALLLAAGVAADCPNACSGNGRCSAPLDYCQCYSGYMGNDCSQRVCPFGLAWVDSPQGDLNHDNVLTGGFGDRTQASGQGNRPTGTDANTALTPMWRPKGWWERHPSQLYGTVADASGSPAGDFLDMYVRAQEGHFYSECSSRGLCDRETGVCNCFTGYEGAACNRTACPNDCSGHGVCESLRQNIASADADYRLWDSDKSYGCVCDAEYTAADCSQRRCYKNNDPLTSVTSERGFSEKLAEQNEVQRIKIACANGGAVVSGSTIKLSYTDVQFGETYTTGNLDVDGSSTSTEAAAILSALRGLPNDVLASTDGYDKVLGVSALTQLNGNDLKDHHNNAYWYYLVTFDSSLGDVPLMTANTDGMVCKAGWLLPSDWQTSTWYDTPAIAYLGSGSTMGPLVDMTVEFQHQADNDKADWRVYINDAAAAFGDYAPVTFTAGTATSLPNDAAKELLPVTFNFPGGDDYRGVAAGSTLKIEFKAGAPAVTIETPSFTTSASLPISYALLGDNNDDDDWMFVQFSNPNNMASIDESGYADATVAAEISADGTRSTCTLDSTDNDQDGTFNCPGAGEWVAPAGDANSEDSTDLWANAKVSFLQGGAANTWRMHEKLGRVSKTQTGGSLPAVANVDYIDVTWNSNTEYPLGPVNIHMWFVAIGNGAVAGYGGGGRFASGGSNHDLYAYSYNGEVMGVFATGGAAHALGEDGVYGNPGDVNTFRIATGTDSATAFNGIARTTADHHYFSMVMNPIQSSWGYVDTFTAFYHAHYDAATVAAVTPVTDMPENILYTPDANSNIGFVLNFVDISGAADAYRWKLSSDEVWTTASAGSNVLNTGLAARTGEFTHTFWPFNADSATDKHAVLANFGFDLSLGIDASTRSCDDSVNSYLYIQLGQEGINDFNECSDRGLCNVETGECECFKGYKGTDCSIQSALAF